MNGSSKKSVIRFTLSSFALSMLCVQALVQAEESNVLTGTSVGVALLYSDLSLKSYPYSFLLHKFFEQDPSNYSSWIDLDKSKLKYLTMKRKRCNIDPEISLGYSFYKKSWYFGIFGEASFGKSIKKYEMFDNRLTLSLDRKSVV